MSNGTSTIVPVPCIPTQAPSSTGVQLILEWVAVVVLVIMSGLFSGLNLGLMSLDPSGLQIVISGGIEPNASYAKVIVPIRKHGNWLLCTLLLGNVAVNAALPIVLSDKAGGTIGFIVSTAAITMFGEIIPQAACSRYALFVGAKTRYLVWVMMYVIGILSWPISLALDCILDEELPTIYSNKGLQKLIEIHELAQDSTVNKLTAKMLKGALGLDDTLVKDRMTEWDDVFHLESSVKLDFDTLAKIFKTGHSRVPIVNKHITENKYKLIGILYIKDLILIDPDDEIPVTKIMNAFDYPVPKLIHKNSSLADALNVFIKYQTHIAVVSHENLDSYDMSGKNIVDKTVINMVKNIDKDANLSIPDIQDGVNGKSGSGVIEEGVHEMSDLQRNHSIANYQTNEYHFYAGIITLEDVIERILQTELIDEHDNYIDNEKTKKTTRLKRINWNILTMFDHKKKEKTDLDISEIKAIYSFLVQTVNEFKPNIRKFSERSIQNLISKSKVTRIKVNDIKYPDNDIYNDGLVLYELNKTTKYLTIILHGKCEVFSGKQKFRIEQTRWDILCADALTFVKDSYKRGNSFFSYVTDFDCRVIEDSRILRIDFDDFIGVLSGKFDYELPAMLKHLASDNDKNSKKMKKGYALVNNGSGSSSKKSNDEDDDQKYDNDDLFDNKRSNNGYNLMKQNRSFSGNE